MATQHFPDEITMEILFRLPEKSLLRFTCVSKYWKSLISHDHSFKALYRRHKTLNPDPPLILVFQFQKNSHYTLTTFDLYGKLIEKWSLPTTLSSLSLRMTKPSESKLVCFFGWDYYYKLSFHLYNPTKKQLIRSILHPSSSSTRLSELAFGFGYDKCKDEYTIACLDLYNMKVCIHSNDAWEFIDISEEEIKYLNFTLSDNSDYGVFICGVFYWLAEDDDRNCVIVCFHLEKREFSISRIYMNSNDELSKSSVNGRSIRSKLMEMKGELYYKMVMRSRKLMRLWKIDIENDIRNGVFAMNIDDMFGSWILEDTLIYGHEYLESRRYLYDLFKSIKELRLDEAMRVGIGIHTNFFTL